jgi:hypothetical protein
LSTEPVIVIAIPFEAKSGDRRDLIEVAATSPCGWQEH